MEPEVIISEVKDWMQRNYDVKIYGYLQRCTEDDWSKCTEKIADFFLYKQTFPKYLLSGDMRESDFSEFCKSVYCFYLPQITEDGNRIFIDKVTNDERFFDIRKLLKYYCMQTELRFVENEIDNGDIILFDCNNINLLHFVTFIPYFLKALVLITKIYPLRLKLLVLINTGRFMETLINWFKILLPKKFREVLFVYEGSGHFSKHVSIEILPVEYGGKQFTMNDLRENCFQKLFLNCDWFVKANNEILNMTIEQTKEFCKISDGNGISFKSLRLD